jgi:glycyl-tRNA synthetase
MRPSLCTRRPGRHQGHVDAFNDPLVDNKDSKKRYRADQLIEGYAEKIEAKIQKDVDKAKEKFGESFDETMYRATNPRVLERQQEIDAVLKRMNDALRDGNMEDLGALINECGITCEVSGSKNWTEVRQFNLMFNTQLGNIAGEEGKLYSKTGNGSGHLCQLPQCTKIDPPKNSIWYCPNR